MLNLNNTYKKLTLFFPLFIISVVFYIPNIGGFGYSLPFNLFTLLTSSLVIFTVVHCACLKNLFEYDNFFFALCIFFIFLCLPVLISDEFQFYKSLPRFLTILFGLLYYFSLMQLKPEKSYLTLLLLLICTSSFVSSCFSLFQNYLMTSESYFAVKIEYGRPTGIFQQVNVLASFTATGIAVCLYLLNSLKNKYLILFLITCVFVNFWVLFLTQSRTGLLAGAILICYYSFIYFKSKEFKKIIILIGILITSLTLAKTLPYGAGNDYITKKEVISSPTIRMYIYQDSLELFLQEPITGHGYGSFHRQLTDYSAGKAIERNNINYGKKVTHPHNELLLWMVEGGAIAGVAIVLIFSYFCYLIYYSKHKNKLGVFLLSMPILLHTLTEHPFYQSTIHFVFFVTLIYITLKQCSIPQRKINLDRSLIKILNLLIVLCIVIFSLTALQSVIKLKKYIYDEPNNHILLSQTLNPFIDYKFKEIQTNTLKLEFALQQNNYNEINEFILWSEGFLKAYPSDYIYFETIRAMKALLMMEQAEELNNKAKYLYPQNNSWETGIWVPSKN